MMVLTAEDDVVISTTSASEDASDIVIGIAVRLWALRLEESGIVTRRALVLVLVRAAVVRLTESNTSTFAPIPYFQF